MTIKLTALVLAASLASAGCTSIAQRNDPKVVSLSPAGLSMTFKEGRLTEATELATKLCADQGKTATLDRVTPTNEHDRMASYTCS